MMRIPADPAEQAEVITEIHAAVLADAYDSFTLHRFSNCSDPAVDTAYVPDTGGVETGNNLELPYPAGPLPLERSVGRDHQAGRTRPLDGGHLLPAPGGGAIRRCARGDAAVPEAMQRERVVGVREHGGMNLGNHLGLRSAGSAGIRIIGAGDLRARESGDRRPGVDQLVGSLRPRSHRAGDLGRPIFVNLQLTRR